MSKLNQGELLEWFDKFVFSDIGSSINRECAEGHENCQAYQQIKEMIQKPEVTEEWIEEKALELSNEIHLESYRCSYVDMGKKFIRSLVEEIK